jgi:hypothetical protein
MIVMARKKIIEIKNQETPQESLEKILKTEIEIAEKISQAKETAEIRVETALDHVAALKNSIIEIARKDREQMLAKGVMDAKTAAEKNLEQAKKESEIFKGSGIKFLEEAIHHVEAVILGEFAGEEE